MVYLWVCNVMNLWSTFKLYIEQTMLYKFAQQSLHALGKIMKASLFIEPSS